MTEVRPNRAFARLLDEFGGCGGVIDYVLLRPESDDPPVQQHRAAAIAGMAAIDRRLEQYARAHASPEHPAGSFWRVTWDEAKLRGEFVSLSKFWGTDDVAPKPVNAGAWSIPLTDGYKTAFFHPPYGLRASVEEQQHLFAAINEHVLGPDPQRCEVHAWSTDWSNYFDAGHEWWGAFYWTIWRDDTGLFVVIAASSTD